MIKGAKGEYREWLIAAVFLIVTLSGYYCLAYVFPQKQERAFLSRMERLLTEGNGQFNLAGLTDFSWDHVDVLVQPDDSFTESSVSDYVKAKHYEASFWEMAFLPRFLHREYEAAFIFTKARQVVTVVRLSTREVIVDNTVYYFNPIFANGQDYVAVVENLRDARPWLIERTGVAREATLTFYRKKDN